MVSNISKKAKLLIAKNIFMSLATSDRKGNCWVAPVNYFYYDSAYNFYFVSSRRSTHIKHITQNPNVALAIFDSRARGKDVDGIQIKGRASVVGRNELAKVLGEFSKARVFGDASYGMDKFERNGIYRFIKVTTIKAYKTDYSNWDKEHIDCRVAVELK